MIDYDLDILFSFKTVPKFFWKERDGLKNNTVRRFDLEDYRFSQLLCWSEIGWNDGDIKIEIVNSEKPESFVRDIRDITFFDGLMIITWNHPRRKKRDYTSIYDLKNEEEKII